MDSTNIPTSTPQWTDYDSMHKHRDYAKQIVIWNNFPCFGGFKVFFLIFHMQDRKITQQQMYISRKNFFHEIKMRSPFRSQTISLRLEDYGIIIMVFIIAENMEWEGGIPHESFFPCWLWKYSPTHGSPQ